jgi:hypothetical protein
MPKQNRVTPFGELLATEARGTPMGSRGCLHDELQRIRRAFACRRWTICVLEFRGRQRAVMTPESVVRTIARVVSHGEPGDHRRVPRASSAM